MASFILLFINLVSILPFVAGNDELSEIDVWLNKKKINISDSLVITVHQNNAKFSLPTCLQVFVNKEGVLPDPHLQTITDDGETLTGQPITFSSSETPLFDRPVNVTISVSTVGKGDTCARAPDQGKNLLATSTVLLYDNRVSIRWSNEKVDCFVDDHCDVSAKIGHTDFSWEGPLDLTATILNSTNECTIISPVNSKNAEVNFDCIFHQVGSFTAYLSVPDALMRSVYCDQPSVSIKVKTSMLQSLRSRVDTLESIVKEMQCQLLGCGDYSTCVNNSCVCTLPKVYNGTKCTDFVGCKNSDNPCKGGENGHCQPPLDPLSDNKWYSCKCLSESVSGQDCDFCDRNFCSNHGNCVVKEGQPTCDCDKPPDCGDCKEGWTGDSCDQTNIPVEMPSPNPSPIPSPSPAPTQSTSPLPTPSAVPSASSPSTNPNPCDSTPCQNEGSCSSDDDVHEGYTCDCPSEYTGDNCEIEKTAPISTPDSNSHLLYGGLAVFIAVLVVCVAAYLAYHNKDKIYELFGGKSESVVEMAMRSRTKKKKGYQKLPTSIHDTLTHED